MCKHTCVSLKEVTLVQEEPVTWELFLWSWFGFADLGCTKWNVQLVSHLNKEM